MISASALKMKVSVRVIAICTILAIDEELAQLAHPITLVECPGIKDPPSTVPIVVMIESTENISSGKGQKAVSLPQVVSFYTSGPERFFQLLPQRIFRLLKL